MAASLLNRAGRLMLLSCVPLLLAAQVRTPAAPRVHARIEGTVYDSLGRRTLTEAIVRVVRADNPATGRTAKTDVIGRFVIDSVATGTWVATFLHPVLDSLRLEPGVVRIDINEAGTVTVPLTIPSARTLAAINCRIPLAADMGVIVGEVRSAADDHPLVGAQVEVEWPEWVLQKGQMVTSMGRRAAKSDSTGRYVVCGAPSGSTLRGIAFAASDTSGAVELTTTEAGYTQYDFSVAPVEHLAVRVDSVGNAPMFATVRRGKAIVRGQVTTADRRPIAGAIVRVLGSGTQARTNATGAYTIADAGAGTQTVEARAIGYQPMRMAVRLTDGAPTELSLRLPVQRVQLDTVRVMAGKELPVEIRAIERRWRTGVGTIMDGRTVRDRSSVFVTDALRGINGVTVRQVGSFGQTVLMRGSNGEECVAGVIMDGQVLPPSQAASISVDEMARREDVSAIEVYPRPSMIPAEFTSMAAGCGVVAIWTKRGTRGVAPVKSKPADR